MVVVLWCCVMCEVVLCVVVITDCSSRVWHGAAASGWLVLGCAAPARWTPSFPLRATAAGRHQPSPAPPPGPARQVQKVRWPRLGWAWPRECSQPKLFPEATNQFQVGSRRAEQVQQPRPRHQLTSYPRAMRRRGPPGHRLVRRGARDISLARSAHHTT